MLKARFLLCGIANYFLSSVLEKPIPLFQSISWIFLFLAGPHLRVSTETARCGHHGTCPFLSDTWNFSSLVHNETCIWFHFYSCLRFAGFCRFYNFLVTDHCHKYNNHRHVSNRIALFLTSHSTIFVFPIDFLDFDFVLNKNMKLKVVRGFSRVFHPSGGQKVRDFSIFAKFVVYLILIKLSWQSYWNCHKVLWGLKH